jgi:hypothetical protein
VYLHKATITKGSNSWYINEKAARLNRACSHSHHSQQHFMIFLRWKSHVAAKNDAKADAENGLIRQDDYRINWHIRPPFFIGPPPHIRPVLFKILVAKG